MATTPVSVFTAAGKAALERLRANRALKPIPVPKVDGNNFLCCGVDAAEGRKITYRFFFNAEKRHLSGVCHFGRQTEGPTDHVHGGASAAVLDTSMGITSWWSGLKCVTANLSMNYRAMLPLNTSVGVEAWIESEEDRKVTVQALIRDLNTERVFCDSSAIFVKLTDAQKEKLKNKNQPGVMAKI